MMKEPLTPETLFPIRTDQGEVLILDQTLLPHHVSWLPLESLDAVIEAIQTMKVRGAPAIGVAGAFGVALAVRSLAHEPDFLNKLNAKVETLVAARPTAVNLAWACKAVLEEVTGLSDPDARIQKAFETAETIRQDDIYRCQSIGRCGAELIQDGDQLLTICNAGALATAGYGTALGVIRAAVAFGKRVHVWVLETRPRLQGAKLTTLELKTLDIPHTLVTDSMVGYLMSQEKVSSVFVGADRVAMNGDTANKIGTYTVAVLAHAHRVPFYVAAPWSTFDLDCSSGKDIPIETRSQDEVLKIQNELIPATGVQALNMAFDVTPQKLITAFVTEHGILQPPFGEMRGSH